MTRLKAYILPSIYFQKKFLIFLIPILRRLIKENNRHGALIESPFKRKLISREDYLRNCIIYIHRNPENEDFTNYPYSSFKSIVSKSKTALKRNESIELFDDIENFILCHQRGTEYEF